MTKSCVICGEEFKARVSVKTCSRRCLDTKEALRALAYRDIRRDADRVRRVANRDKERVRLCEKRNANIELYRKYGRDYYAKNRGKISKSKRNYRSMKRKTKTLLMLMALPSAIKETVNQTNP
jgi:hypothetical protein